MLKVIGMPDMIESGEAQKTHIIGKKAEQLRLLDRAGIKIGDTLVLEAGVFSDYRQNGTVSEQLLDDAQTCLTTGDFGNASKLAVRPSLAKEYLGLPEIVFSDKSYTQLKYTIERIYRAWSDEKCNASRISRGISEDESRPAIIIQSGYPEVQTIVSRSSRTGLKVSRDDDYNVQIKVTNLGAQQITLAAKVEHTLSRPIKVHFVSAGQSLAVLGTSDQLMPDRARFVAFQDLLKTGVADEIDLILSVRVRDMIVHSSFDEEAYEENEFVCGIAASPGVARCQIGFRTTNLAEYSVRPILFAVNEVSPEDTMFVSLARAALSTTGGKASHLAVMCRGWGKTCIVGMASVQLDEQRKEIVIHGDRYPEFTEFVISGTSGRLYLVGDPRSGYKARKGYNDFLPRLAEVVQAVMGSDELRRRSFEDQERIAETIFFLRKVQELP